MKTDLQQLSEDILSFITQYARISPNYNPELDSDDEKYTSPDVYQLLGYADYINKHNNVPNFHPWSEWSSGGYGRLKVKINFCMN